MNVLVVHNRYAFAGGEDAACASEVELLRKYGHRVVVYEQDNRTIRGTQKWTAGVRAVWSQQDYRAVRRLIAAEKLELMSVHNFFPLVSPSVYYAAKAEGIAVVQTLHNYRLVCPAATFLRDGRICEDCLGKTVAWPAVRHKCYRRSTIQTASVVGMVTVHKVAGTWGRMVDRYIALTPFMREKMIEGGLTAEKVVVKANSVEDTGVGTGDGDHFVFVGRLSEEKGVHILLDAWRQARTGRRLKIIGTGPEEMNLRAKAMGMMGVEFLGQIEMDRVRKELGTAAAVVFPSIWYEGLSRVVVEALSKGTPVIASELGPIAAVVREGHGGVLFQVGDAAELATRMEEFPRRGEAWDGMRRAARAEYQEKYTDEVVYRQLMDIYEELRPKQQSVF